MVVIVADGFDDGIELSARRDRFTCADFSYTIAPDEHSGVVLLLPERRTLTVSGAWVHYVCVRVYTPAGRLLGSMACALDGRVTWSAPA